MGAGTIGLKAIFSAEDRGVSATVARLASAVRALQFAGDRLGKLDAMNARVAGSLRAAGVGLSAFGFGAGMIAKNIIGAGADFEQAITNVGAVSLMTRDQIGDLEKRALSLGRSTKYSATEVAGAMEVLGRVGYTTAETLQGIEGILAGAGADGGDLVETATAITSAMKGMGMATSETSRVSDVLTLASARTNSSIGSLSESMKSFGPVARSLNIPFESSIAQLALLQDAGLDASMAGTSLAATYSKLAAPMGETKTALAELGIVVADGAGDLKKPDVLLAEILAKTNKIKGNVGKMAAVTRLVGLESQKALLNVAAAAGSGKLEALTKELIAAEGSAKKMAGIRMDTFSGDIETLGGSIDGLKIKIFNMESGPLRDVVKGMTSWVDANEDLIATGVGEKVKEWTPLVEGFGKGLAASSQSLKPILGGVSDALAKVFGGGGDIGPEAKAYFLARNLTKAAGAFAAFSIGIKVARLGVSGFSGALRVAHGVAKGWEFLKDTHQAFKAFKTAADAADQGAGSLVSFGQAMSGVAGDAKKLLTFRESINAMFDGWASKAGLAAGAAGALYLAWDQLDKFQKENGGWEGAQAAAAGVFGIGVDSWGLEGAFQGVDMVMNSQAQADTVKGGFAVAPDFISTPQGAALADRYGAIAGMPSAPVGRGQYAAAFGLAPAGMPQAPAPAAPSVAPQAPSASEFKAMVQQELTVNLKTDAGTSAEVTKKPPGAKVNLQPSGAP